MSATPDRLDVSVVIPVYGRVGDLRRLLSEFSAVLRERGDSFEFLLVAEDGNEPYADLVRTIQADDPDTVSVVLLPKFFGEATALAAGFDQARGRTIVTSAAFFQVEPNGLAEALDEIGRGKADLLIGRRHPRRGSLLNRFQSQVFHWAVRLITSTPFRDINCGFRVMSRDVAEQLNLYGDLHTFLPILALNLGFRVEEIRLEQHPEDQPKKIYGPGVLLRRLLDILTVLFLTKFTRRPLRFFGAIGLLLFGAGFAITLYLGVYRILGFGGIADRPLLLLGILLMVLGVQSISIGLLGEIIIFTYSRDLKEYRVVEVIEKTQHAG